MLEVFFVSVLVVTSRVPPEGWLQWTQTYNDREVCEAVVRKDGVKVALAIERHMGKKFIKIKAMRCLTYKEAVFLNSKLGH